MLTPTRDTPDDAGLSLVEVLVAMVISVVVGSMTLLFLLSAVGSARRADGQNEQAASARTVLDSWAQLVPLAVDPNGQSAAGAVRFYSIGPQSARFCVGLGTKSMAIGGLDELPSGVELALVGDDLVEKRYATCAGMKVGGAHVTRILSSNAALAAPGVWLLTPLGTADLPTGGVSTALLPSALAVGQVTLNAVVQDDSLQIAKIVGLQLAFRTTAAPGRPSPDAIYTSVLALTKGG